MSNRFDNVEGILAVDLHYGLAKDGMIPWKSKTDLKFFKDKTINNVVVMGLKTLLSLPKAEPLKNRINIVVTNNFNKYCKLYEKYDNIFFVNGDNIMATFKNLYKNLGFGKLEFNQGINKRGYHYLGVYLKNKKTL